jgi:hypothetical protein
MCDTAWYSVTFSVAPDRRALPLPHPRSRCALDIFVYDHNVWPANGYGATAAEGNPFTGEAPPVQVAMGATQVFIPRCTFVKVHSCGSN